jgi:peptide/nickel transport system substrate-binding protein
MIRRQLAAVSAAFVILLGLALSGCSRRAADADQFQDSIAAPADPLVESGFAAGRYGGRFVYGETRGPRTFNPIMVNETSSSDITDRLFIGLTSYDKATQKVSPMLAKTWELAEDGLTWTFHLRQGAAFSDGHPMTANDVLFSFTVVYDEVLHPPGRDLVTMGGQPFVVAAPDALTVTIKTPKPNAMVDALAGSVPVLPRHVLERAFTSGGFGAAYALNTKADDLVTSGPWRLSQFTSGEKTVLTRNPYWFGVDQDGHRLPYLKELVYLVAPDQDAADLKFRTGELDALDPVAVKPENYGWYEQHQNDGGFTLHSVGPRLSSYAFWFNLNPVRKAAPNRQAGTPYVGAVKYGWFNNRTFRRAVSLAIDRDAMIRSVFFGSAVKNWSTATEGNTVWHSADVVRYDYNPEESKRLLSSLGWKDRDGDGVLEDERGNAIRFSLKTNSDDKLRIGMANFVRDDLAKVGIRVALAPVDFNGLITNIREDFDYDAALLAFVPRTPDPTLDQNRWRSGGRAHLWNVAQPSPETREEARIDQLMDTMVSVPDLTARKTAWKEIETIVNEQSWVLWLPTQVLRVPVRNRFGNVQPTPFTPEVLRGIEHVYTKREG